MGSQTGPEYINRCVDIYSGLLGFCESARMCKWTVKSLKLAFHDIFMEKIVLEGGGRRVRKILIFIHSHQLIFTSTSVFRSCALYCPN